MQIYTSRIVKCRIHRTDFFGSKFIVGNRDLARLDGTEILNQG